MIPRIPSRPSVSVHRQPRGFTLIELLVVITIIAVVAALSAGAAMQMSKRAHKAREVSNLRNITQLVITYHADHNVLPGPVHTGIRLPSAVGRNAGDRHEWLSTFLIDEGFLPEDDDIWLTSLTDTAKKPQVTYVLNNSETTAPTWFFGSMGTDGRAPKSLASLRSNLSEELGGRGSMDIIQIWLACTADDENFSASASGGAPPLPDGAKSSWGGRHYSFFDGRVEFIKRTPTSTYPSSYAGNHL